MLPYRRPGRPCRAVRPLSLSAHCLQLLPQSALPQVSVARQCPLERGTPRRFTAGPIFPCRVHSTRGGRGDRLSEQSCGVCALVPRGSPDAAHDRGRSATLGSANRLDRRAAHLGPDAAVSSSRALYRTRRRPQPRWATVGGLSCGLLSARPCALALLSHALLSLAPESVCAAAPPVLLDPCPAGGCRALCRLPHPAAHHRVGGLRQAALWRPTTRTGLSGPLYTPSSDRQSSLGSHRQRSCLLPLA